MAARAGTVTFFMLDSAAGALTNISPYCNDISVPQSIAQLDVTGFGTAGLTYIPGIAGGDTIAVRGAYDSVIALQLGSLLAAQAAGTASHSWLYGPGGSVSGQAKITGECLVQQYVPASSVAGRVEWSAVLQITGAVTNASF